MNTGLIQHSVQFSPVWPQESGKNYTLSEIVFRYIAGDASYLDLESIAYMDHNVTRTFDLLERYRLLFDMEDALCFKQNGAWKKFSSKEYIEYSYSFCYGLYETGLRKGEKIITVSTSRPEWNFADMGMAMIGVVHVPVFASLSTSEYEYIIRDSGARMIIISDKKLFRTLEPALAATGESCRVITFDEVEGKENWISVVERGRHCSSTTRHEVEALKNQIAPDDFATLIYTSGTTGKTQGSDAITPESGQQLHFGGISVQSSASRQVSQHITPVPCRRADGQLPDTVQRRCHLLRRKYGNHSPEYERDPA